MKRQIPNVLIIFFALFLRLYGIDWDQGFHLHPDERMLIMVADRINFFNQLNPSFFNYGSLPIYLLKGIAQIIDYFFSLNLANYQKILYLGRFLSLTFDLVTIYLIYNLAKILFKKEKIAFYSAFFYSIAFFPIQNTHFFISDVFLTTFTTLLILLIIKTFKNLHVASKQRSDKNITLRIFLMAIVFAAMTATKFTAVIFYPLIIFLIFLLTFYFSKGKIKNKFLNFLRLFFLFNFSFLIFNFLFMPYAFLDFKKFIADISLQIKMNNNPYIFPYTLQYVNTLPYLYYLKNIFFWGLGPVIALLAILGIFLIIKSFLKITFIKKNSKSKIKNYHFQITNYPLLFVFLFYTFYFLIIGRSAVKFMRYMLPLYPFFTISSGLALYKIKNLKLNIKNFIVFGLMFFAIFWSLMFINIYSQKHTRIVATEWILKNIPAGSTLAVEHWDDRIPLYDFGYYQYVELSLYELPDDYYKWENLINPQLTQADYIVIASNRLYIPLQKLADCQKYKVCYPKTAQYYKKLFNGQLGFKKIAEFAVYPQIKIGSFKIKINDQTADESFTVYDHPKILIFKKVNSSLPQSKMPLDH